MDDRTASFYRKQYGTAPAPLNVGDTFTVPDHPGDVFTVVDFAAGGMLVEAVRNGSAQELSFPRRYVPWLGQAFFIEAN